MLKAAHNNIGVHGLFRLALILLSFFFVGIIFTSGSSNYELMLLITATLFFNFIISEKIKNGSMIPFLVSMWILLFFTQRLIALLYLEGSPDIYSYLRYDNAKFGDYINSGYHFLAFVAPVAIFIFFKDKWYVCRFKNIPYPVSLERWLIKISISLSILGVVLRSVLYSVETSSSWSNNVLILPFLYLIEYSTPMSFVVMLAFENKRSVNHRLSILAVILIFFKDLMTGSKAVFIILPIFYILARIFNGRPFIKKRAALVMMLLLLMTLGAFVLQPLFEAKTRDVDFTKALQTFYSPDRNLIETTVLSVSRRLGGVDWLSLYASDQSLRVISSELNIKNEFVRTLSRFGIGPRSDELIPNGRIIPELLRGHPVETRSRYAEYPTLLLWLGSLFGPFSYIVFFAVVVFLYQFYGFKIHNAVKMFVIYQAAWSFLVGGDFPEFVKVIVLSLFVYYFFVASFYFFGILRGHVPIGRI